ncbi:MAG: hypothetical protein ACYTG0_36400 [Planctomycetota bacterium]|jgi:hypothetical protein
MKHICWLFPAAVVALFSSVARAETALLELKSLDFWDRAATSPAKPLSEALCRNVLSQTIHIHVGDRGASGEEAFSRIVRKEPDSYSSEGPARGVVTFGSQPYAFVLVREGQGRDAYRRLHFDLNHNGDLTDDKVVEALRPDSRAGVKVSPYYSTFPRIDLKTDTDGVKTDYAFSLQVVYTQPRTGKGRVDAMFRAAVYRQGAVKLNGKLTKIVVLDFNSNGRFDDLFVSAERLVVYSTAEKHIFPRLVLYPTAEKRIYPEMGDKILVDLDRETSASPYERAYAGVPVSKLVELEGRFYDLKIRGAGDRLTLTPSRVPIGYVTNAAQEFCALVYGEDRCLKITASNGRPVPLPVGHWRLASCIVSHTITPETSNHADRADQQIRMMHPPYGMAGRSQVYAQATVDSPEIEVFEGRTVDFPFGPPYVALMHVSAVHVNTKPRVASLRMSLIGSGKEACNRIVVNGKTMPDPTFTIRTKAGECVEQGLLDAGCDILPRWCFWEVPSDLEEEYHIHVDVDAGPFEVRDEQDSVITASQLRP